MIFAQILMKFCSEVRKAENGLMEMKKENKYDTTTTFCRNFADKLENVEIF